MIMTSFADYLKPHPQADGASILARERAQSSLSVDELSHHLFSRDGFLERQQRVLSILEKEPLFKKTNQLNLSRPDRYYLGLARAKMLRRLSDEHGWDTADDKMALYLIDETSPYLVHVNMFQTTIQQQASEKQKEVWLEKSEKYQIIGAYAQV
jgi:acyl-CoA oxidase